MGAVLSGPNPVFLPCLDSVALTAGLSPSLPGWCREVSRAPSPGYWEEAGSTLGEHSTASVSAGWMPWGHGVKWLEDVGIAHAAGRTPPRAGPHPKGTERCRALGAWRGVAEDRGLSWAGRGLPSSICWPDGRWDPCLCTSCRALLGKESCHL